MGAVYLATDLRLNSKVAVKENLDMSPESQKQFEAEAHILAKLKHPNLPRVQDLFRRRRKAIPRDGLHRRRKFGRHR
jgi:serine/threonine-protein kinase